MCLDAMNVLLLLEKLDPTFQEHLKRAHGRTLWAITQLQGWTRGIEARAHFKRRRDLVTKIQQRWRGAMTRKKLLAMLDQYKWRKRQISNYFAPTSKVDRQLQKKVYSVGQADKDVTVRATNVKLQDLKQAILSAGTGNPLEDLSRTTQEMSDSYIENKTSLSSQYGRKTLTKRLPVFSTYETSRFSADKAELTTKDIRQVRDSTLRDLMRLNDKDELEDKPKVDTGAGVWEE